MTAPSLFPDVEGNAALLQAWLQDRLEGFGGVMEVERLHGGRSNPGWRLRTAHRDCVLRARPGPRANLLPSAHAIEREFRVQRALAGSAVPVAAMHVLCEDEAIIGAKAVLDNGTRLLNVSVIHFDDDNRITLRQDAESATLEDGYWLLKNVHETRSGELPVRLDEVQLRTNLKREFVQESLDKPETIAFFDLGRKIEAAKSFGFPTNAMETQFHSLLSLPLLLVAMTLIAACVSLKFSRFNQSRAVILGGILSGFMLYVVTVLVKAFGSSGVVPPFVAAWLPVVIAMSLGATILLHQEDG